MGHRVSRKIGAGLFALCLTAPVQDGSRLLAQQSAPAGSLKIVVIEGEDSINIIEQKTAVKPIVEVRDRNDLPVANAAVTFVIAGRGNAVTFANGARQITVATDAAGRATVNGLNPLNRGVFQIQVRAAAQGQTATATIHQANVLTAAEAAAAPPPSSGAASGGGGSAGGAGGAGGAAGGAAGAAGAAGAGLSTAALAGIVAGGAAAGIATTMAVKSSEESNDPPAISAVTPSVASVLVGTSAGVSFSAQVSDPNNDALTYTWDFGDGTTGSGPSPTHAYNNAGTYTVRLTVSDGKNTVTSQTTVTVKSLTGDWIAPGSGDNSIWRLTQSGSSVTGTYIIDPSVVSQYPGFTWNYTGTGTVQTTSPRVRMSWTWRISATSGSSTLSCSGAWSFSFDPTDVDNLSGSYSGSTASCSAPGTSYPGFSGPEGSGSFALRRR